MSIGIIAGSLPVAVLAQVPAGTSAGANTSTAPSIEKALDPKKPAANLETCADPRIGKDTMISGAKGKRISYSVTVFRVPGTDQVAGYYSDYFDVRTGRHLSGIFFDRAGNLVATLGLPGENLSGGSLIPIYDYRNPAVKLGYLKVIKEDSFPSFDPGDPPLLKLSYVVVNRGFDRIFTSDSFAAIELKRLNSTDGYALDQTDYNGAIVEIDSLGQAARLAGVIKKFCPSKP